MENADDLSTNMNACGEMLLHAGANVGWYTQPKTPKIHMAITIHIPRLLRRLLRHTRHNADAKPYDIYMGWPPLAEDSYWH